MPIRRASFNELKSLEIGSTSDWYCYFSSYGSKAPSPDKFNLIKGSPAKAPVSEISYNDYTYTADEIELPLGIPLFVPAALPFVETKLSLTVYDDYRQSIRSAIWEWVHDKFDIKNFRAPPVHSLEDYSMKFTIVRFNRANEIVRETSYYVLPPENLPNQADYEFGLDTYPFELNVIGVEV